MYFAGDLAQGITNAFKQVEQATKGVTSGTFKVSKDNVLAAARIIESQADALQVLWTESLVRLRIDPPGNDSVSQAMASAWNDLLVTDEDSYKNRVKEYVLGLKKLAVQLGDTAKAYGYSEEEIEAAFGRKA